MLIDLDNLVKKYNMDIRGVLHIGAHECEEMEKYLHYVTKDKVVWLEGNPVLVEKMKRVDPEVVIYHAIVSDQAGNDITLKITNNGQSSSILDFADHAKDYPWCVFIDEYQGKSTTVREVYRDHGISSNFANFLNIDIQGAELLALKGMGDLLHYFDYLYLEINIREMYKNCPLVHEIDDYLRNFGFSRVETSLAGGWGDGFYMRV